MIYEKDGYLTRDLPHGEYAMIERMTYGKGRINICPDQVSVRIGF